MAKKTKKIEPSVKEKAAKKEEKKKDDHCYTCGGNGEEGGCAECGKVK